ncbi:DNA-binding response regulator [Lysobacter sp. TY2-98]|uniref:response regulator n=1 Tax=Lysobacter sp. TY2-98 TaxID=2290922 RepID=UPI000E1FEC4D|nr:response regulator transcription factor [Lysobacter sp. TY2-98]AXK72159.1 DNA-binding response regulator [Lysobacter sp. TY2-98]
MRAVPLKSEALAPTTPARILVVEDEPQMRKFLDISLRAQGYDVVLAGLGREGVESLALHGADIVVLDMHLPDGDGRHLIGEIRQWSDVPVIVLSVTDDEATKVEALDAGANDYVTKPFGVQELLARIRALLRLPQPSTTRAPVFDDGLLHVDLARRLVTVGGVPVQLTRKEYALLSMLIQHAGRVVTQKQLLKELWGPSYENDTHYLRILAGRLRNKLGDDAMAPRWIATEPRVGLRFIPG